MVHCVGWRRPLRFGVCDVPKGHLCPQQSDFVITHFRVQDVVPGIESGIVNVVGDARDIARIRITIHIRRSKME